MNVIKTALVGGLLGLGTLLFFSVPAHADPITQPANFNMTVPPIVIDVPAPTPAPVVVSQAPAQDHQTVSTEPTTTTTVAPTPCPTDGTPFAYGSCTVPSDVPDAHLAEPGAPSQISDPAGCGQAVVPQGYTIDNEGVTCNPTGPTVGNGGFASPGGATQSPTELGTVRKVITGQ